MKDRKKVSALPKLRQIFDLDGLFPTADILELRDTCELDAHGCEGILLYSDTMIRLSMKKYVLNIIGKGLFCSSYLPYTIRVRGDISSLELERRGG